MNERWYFPANPPQGFQIPFGRVWLGWRHLGRAGVALLAALLIGTAASRVIGWWAIGPGGLILAPGLLYGSLPYLDDLTWLDVQLRLWRYRRQQHRYEEEVNPFAHTSPAAAPEGMV